MRNETLALDGLDHAPRPRWTGETLPVLYRGARLCPHCSQGHLEAHPPIVEDALFSHGGFGESVRWSIAVCTACHRSSVLLRESVRPPRRPT